MSRLRRREPVKVVFINTEYVETDAMSFKSVVQRLTGKDAPSPASSDPKKMLSHGGGGGGGGGSGGGGVNPPMLKKGMSFRDLDRMLLEQHTMDDIYQFCVD
ncbi:hypothetical protein L1987_84656 [Smallanthus sonchifolius]|uniref:Uncharacterized protein n=1 Tax=Smallanthus sonchifolius TaxID=185202 RepID=A0ACB8XU99_9ASTR|nr:hypothetical protein L1987_84656 [Smallanthus sonchifolius]